MKNIPKIIAVLGLAGSGKSLITDYFKKKSYPAIYFGQITMNELKKRKLTVNPQNEKIVRENIRKTYGMGAYATLSLDKIEQLLKNKHSIIIDGLYSLSEYLILEEKYKTQLFTLAVFTPKNIRYQRLKNRKIRPLKKIEVDQRDLAEIINIEKAGPIAIADYTIINNKNGIEKLYKELEQISQEYKL